MPRLPQDIGYCTIAGGEIAGKVIPNLLAFKRLPSTNIHYSGPHWLDYTLLLFIQSSGSYSAILIVAYVSNKSFVFYYTITSESQIGDKTWPNLSEELPSTHLQLSGPSQLINSQHFSSYLSSNVYSTNDKYLFGVISMYLILFSSIPQYLMILFAFFTSILSSSSMFQMNDN